MIDLASPRLKCECRAIGVFKGNHDPVENDDEDTIRTVLKSHARVSDWSQESQRDMIREWIHKGNLPGVYRVLIQEKIPRSFKFIVGLTGVSECILYKLERVFCSIPRDLTGMRASDWLPGVILRFFLTPQEARIVSHNLPPSWLSPYCAT